MAIPMERSHDGGQTASPGDAGRRGGLRTAGTARRLAALLLGLVLLALAAPGRPAAAAAPGLVDCLDEGRGLVLRVARWECEGRVLSEAEAEAWRQRLQARRVERLREADQSIDRVGERPDATGTGFRVDAGGHFLTNRHVVQGCRRLRLRQDGEILGEATLAALHPRLDVALLNSRIGGPSARFAASLREPGALEIGIVGYPVEGVARVEASLRRVTLEPGVAAGSGDHLRFLGEIQPGNSGSPLLDPWGRVVGMAMAKRNLVAEFARSGTLPPDSGIAVTGPRLIEFLASQGVTADTATRSERREVSALLALARSYVVRIDCWR